MRRAAAALLLTPVLLAGGLLAGVVVLAPSDPATATACIPVGPAVAVAGVPDHAVAGYEGTQLRNAALVVEAGRSLGVDARAQAIGLMTAMGESSLTVLDHGDAVGPDSRGLFQQRDNGAWGSYADRMDPTTSATNFFRALLRVPDWQVLPPTIAAHRTQGNADPYFYTRFWDASVTVLGALADGAPKGVAKGTGALSCTGSTPFTVLAEGWTAPAAGPMTSTFGWREDPTGGGRQFHAGIDLAPGCDAPIAAAAAGVVVMAGPASGYGQLIAIDHGGGVVSRYGHMEDDGLLVVVGQSVVAGQQIARVGSNGDSTACHLHFEVLLGGVPTDPLAFLVDGHAPASG